MLLLDGLYPRKAIKGYHYLMHLAHLINVLAEYSEKLSVYIKENGIRNLIQFALATISGPWLDGNTMLQITKPSYSFRAIKIRAEQVEVISYDDGWPGHEETVAEF